MREEGWRTHKRWRVGQTKTIEEAGRKRENK
jgi:hypothetical protein